MHAHAPQQGNAQSRGKLGLLGVMKATEGFEELQNGVTGDWLPSDQVTVALKSVLVFSLTDAGPWIVNDAGVKATWDSARPG